MSFVLHAPQNDACFVSCDGGRVCRPLIICDKGVPRVTQEHIQRLKDREWRVCANVPATIQF